MIDTLIQYGAAANGSPVVVSEIRHAGGAIARASQDGAAYGNRQAEHLLQMIGVTPTPEAQQHFAAYTDQIKAAMQSSLTGGVYMNFLEGEESRRRVKDGFQPAAFERLSVLKAKYDGENRLAHGFNIRPNALPVLQK